MKNLIRNALILLFPFLLIVIVNEVDRPKGNEQSYSINGVSTINSANFLPDKCTWVCHNNTSFCKKNHVKFLKPYYSKTDVFYHGLIDILKSTGNYGAANIIFLVFLLPFIFWYGIIKSIDLRDKIKQLNRSKL